MLSVWHDFSHLLRIFGAQEVRILIPPQVLIDPNTNEEYYAGTPTEDYISAVVVPAGWEAAEFLPSGVAERADYVLYTTLEIVGRSGSVIDVTVADGRNQPTVVYIDNEPYAVVRDQLWHLGNVRVLEVKRTLPGPPLPT